MTFCAIVPVYRHENSVAKVAMELFKSGIFVILIDDGNSQSAHEILQNLTNKISSSILITHKKNFGKGKAVLSGLQKAYELGFTHALQVDADGQHDLSSLVFFIEEAKKNANSVIAACPKYDKSAPKGRLIGRKITNFWVAVETLSKKIPDSMCGFRIYPVKSVWSVAKNIRNWRMGFDIEILVKLCWAGVDMRFYPVIVKYPQDGISNFCALRDNVQISLTHTKLCIGMLIRLPIFVYKKILNCK